MQYHDIYGNWTILGKFYGCAFGIWLMQHYCIKIGFE